MQVNSAYLNNHIPEVVDNNVPLLITSCGNYRMKSREMFETKRDKGRKDYQLLYIASGRAHFFIDGKENIVTAGNIVIFYPNEPQYYRYYKKEHTSVYWIHFTGSYVEDILTHYNISKNEHIIYIGTSPDLQLLFGQIIHELQLYRPKYDEMLTLLLRNIFIIINRSIDRNKRFTDVIEKEISYATYYFREHFNEDIVETLNRMVSLLQKDYFSRLFHKQIGISPKEYRKRHDNDIRN